MKTLSSRTLEKVEKILEDTFRQSESISEFLDGRFDSKLHCEIDDMLSVIAFNCQTVWNEISRENTFCGEPFNENRASFVIHNLFKVVEQKEVIRYKNGMVDGQYIETTFDADYPLIETVFSHMFDVDIDPYVAASIMIGTHQKMSAKTHTGEILDIVDVGSSPGENWFIWQEPAWLHRDVYG